MKTVNDFRDKRYSVSKYLTQIKIMYSLYYAMARSRLCKCHSCRMTSTRVVLVLFFLTLELVMS